MSASQNLARKTPRELARALKDLKQSGIRALIIDLRGNPGGLLESARDTCDLFLSEGQIVTSRDRFGRIQRAFTGTPETTIFDAAKIPLVILVDRYSASASEIVAACLQDHQLAGIVGERTWGKGTVQNVIPIDGGRSAMRLTTATYWRPSLRNIHRSEHATEEDEWGVRPTDGWEVKLSEEQHQQLVKQLRDRYIVQGSANDGPIRQWPIRQ